jgi:signal transduction histidine kinase
VTNGTKLSVSFSLAAAFLLAVGVASVLLFDHVNHILGDVGFYNEQIERTTETIAALRLHPKDTQQNLALIEDLKGLARTEVETQDIAKAQQAIESKAPVSQAIAPLEQLSSYYRKAASHSHGQLVMIHQWAVHGAIILIGVGTLLLWGLMVLMRRWFINPLFDVHEAIQLAIVDDPKRPVPDNEMRELVAPICEMVAKAKHLEMRATRAERLAPVGEACTRVGQNLRNLVHSMRTMAQHERDAENIDPNAKSALGYVVSTANSMDRWITSLVNAARPLELKSCQQAIEPVIRDSVSLLDPLLLQRDITVAFEHADTVPDVQLDRSLFEQALVAILKNAMDASPDESRILVTTASNPDGSVRVTIADEGEGMSEEVRSRACDPFFTKRKDGVGLGLTHAQRIVELHGGKMTLESEIKKGTRVHIDLPSAIGANDKPGEVRSSATAPPASKSALSASTRR